MPFTALVYNKNRNLSVLLNGINKKPEKHLLWFLASFEIHSNVLMLALGNPYRTSSAILKYSFEKVGTRLQM